MYEFLNQLFDYECYAADEIHLMKKSTVFLPNLNIKEEPDFEWRSAPTGEVIYTQTGSFANNVTGVLANRMRFNLATDIFVTGYDCHNTYTVLNPDDYLAAHKDWYSRNSEGETIFYTPNGKKLPAQLCFSNADMKTQFVTNLKTILQEKINKGESVANMIIGQQDTSYWCECSDCAAAKEIYGTNAAVLIWFVNDVQKEINNWFATNYSGKTPTKLIIFAYQSTEQPPATYNQTTQTWEPINESVILNKDSAVYFAVGGMKMHEAFEDTDSTDISSIYGRMLGWKSCSNSMFAWTYSLYMNHGLLFSNTHDVMQANYQLLKDNGVTLIGDQADAYQKYGNSGFSRLETYLMSKLQWDTELDQNTLTRDFFDNYFGEAADTMLELYHLEKKNIAAKYQTYSNEYSGTFSDEVLTKEFWPQDELKEYQNLIAQAFKDIEGLRTTDPERYQKLYERILLENIQFEYIDSSLYSTDMTTRNTFKNHFEDLGLYSYAEHKTIDELWKKLGVEYAQVISFSRRGENNQGRDGNFFFSLHKSTENGWYKAEAYIDGAATPTPILLNVTGANSACIYYHCFNDNAAANTSNEPTTGFVIKKDTKFTPVTVDVWTEDLSRPSYRLSTELRVTNTNNVWEAGDSVTKAPSQVTMTFNRATDNDNSGSPDFGFNLSTSLSKGYYKAEATIDGNNSLPVLIAVTDSGNYAYIYAGCFNDNGHAPDSKEPQSSFILKTGTILSPVIEKKWTVDISRTSYQLSSDVAVNYSNNGWE